MKKITLTLLAVIFVFAAMIGFAPTTATTTYAATGYHGYLGIQTNTNLWIFRNPYDDAKYGYGTDAFNGLSSIKGTTVTSYDGTFTDVDIPGDGTYTVKLDNPDFQDETNLSQLFVTTDIPYVDSIKVTDVSVSIDGKNVYHFDKGVINPESFNYVQIQCLSLWNPEVENLFSSDVPKSSVEITFTISGIAKAAAAQEEVKDFTFKMFESSASVSGYTGSDTSVKLPTTAYGKKVTAISDNAFQNSSVKEVTIPDSVEKIGKYAFAGSKLISVTIPKGVTTISDGAFASCTGIKKFTVDKGNKNFVVVDGVLLSKDKKTLIQYPAGNSGKSYNVPASVTKIQAGAFEGCTKITKITISKDVKTIGKDAFKGCKSLTIYAPSGSEAYKYADKNKIKVKKN